MERYAIQALKNWKNSSRRKPLIIQGARQVGKTWLMKEFGKKNFQQTAYINFESSHTLKSLFEQDFDIQRIINAIQIESGVRIDAETTLIIFDEIQEAQGAITSLKYFQENAPEYHVLAAGSLLGTTLHQHLSFPVGKVDFLRLYPLSFKEFLRAKKQTSLLQLLESQDGSSIKLFKSKFKELLRQYYFVGGMPEVVSTFIQSNDLDLVRANQKQILNAYELDFSKHAPSSIVPRIRLLWNSIPAQLAKENKKFVYKAVKSGSRAKDYELALAWLVDSGLATRISRVSKPAMPLKAYEDFGAFKLFLVDIGLLGAMSGLDAQTLLEGNKIFTEFKGAMAEQFVLQQLLYEPDLNIYYWSAERSKAEIDFLIQYTGKVISLEVKAEENLQAKSLKSFYQKFSPTMSIRTSMSDFRKEGWLTNLPLYAISELTRLLDQTSS